MARTIVTTDYMKVVQHAAINNLTALTISMMMYKTGTTAVSDRILDKYNTGATGGFYVAMDAGTQLTFEYGRWNGAPGVWLAPEPAKNQWVNVIITYDANSTSNDPNIYYNNVLQSETETSAPSGTLVSENDDVWIGNRSDGIRPFPGALCEIAIYNRVISAEERNALYKKFVPSFFRGLSLYGPIMGRRSPEPNMAPGGGPSITVSGTSYMTHPGMYQRTPGQQAIGY